MNKFQRALKAGYSCMPCKKKRPVLRWQKYIKYPATIEEAENWTGDIGIICGRVSMGLTCIDFDIKNGDRFDSWLYDVNSIKPTLLSKLYIENTPSGGKHVCFRSKKIIKNIKLACNKEGAAMIETRGEGGCMICAPSVGYSVYYGKLAGLEVISDEEQAILLAVAEGFNEYEREVYKPKHKVEVTGDTVFNRYDSAVDPIPLLQKHGWKVLSSRGKKVYLRRPEKKDGISATWNVIPNRFYCFSSSTQFKQEHPYKPSAVYAILEHDGNFKSACRAIAKMEGKY